MSLCTELRNFSSKELLGAFLPTTEVAGFLRVCCENLIAWKALESTARTGSVKEAAVELDMDMSAVSRLVAGLEAEFEIEFLNRRQRPMTLTPAGRALYQPIKDFLRHYEQLAQMTRTMSGEPRRYRLCYPLNVGRDPLIGQLQDYQKN